MQIRKTCRNYFRDLRGNMSQEAVASKSADICGRVLESSEYKDAHTILAYYPLGNEVDCLPILEDALKKGKHVMLPRTAKDAQMDFYEIHNLSDVVEGHFHVMEPKWKCSIFDTSKYEADFYDVSAKEHIDLKILVLVPGVVFDRQGNRYGYGKGYYDRYFERFPYLKRMALAYSEQLSEEPLECLATDVKMHGIVTECEWINII